MVFLETSVPQLAKESIFVVERDFLSSVELVWKNQDSDCR
jgi:hypothetical protein